MIKVFLKNLKKYIDYLMKLGFKELFVNFIEIIMLVIFACVIYLPFGLIRDSIYQLLITFIDFGPVFFNLYNVVLNLIGGVIAFCLFAYMFNNRYEDIEKLRKTESTKSSGKKSTSVDEVDLPKKIK